MRHSDDFLRILMHNVTSLHHLLNDVTSLARLQAGHEKRQIDPLDVTVIIQVVVRRHPPVGHATRSVSAVRRAGRFGGRRGRRKGSSDRPELDFKRREIHTRGWCHGNVGGERRR